MSSFRKPYTIQRPATGSYVNGVWVAGAATNVAIMATIQPVTGEDMKTLPEGRRLSDYVKVYTSTEVFPVSETIQQPDQLVWRGSTYECISVDVRQMDVIAHYKAIFSKVSQ